MADDFEHTIYKQVSRRYHQEEANWPATVIGLLQRRHLCILRELIPESPLAQTVDQDAPVEMNWASASEQCLANHPALVACRRGHATAQLITKLMRVTHLDWFLQRAIYGLGPGGFHDCRIRC